MNDMGKRNFYLQLFRTYCDMPFEETLENFTQVYNDVFWKEKPLTIQKYSLCEITVVEMNVHSPELDYVFSYNFAQVMNRV